MNTNTHVAQIIIESKNRIPDILYNEAQCIDHLKLKKSPAQEQSVFSYVDRAVCSLYIRLSKPSAS